MGHLYFLDALKVLARRRYVVLVGLVLMVVAGGAAIKVVPTQYQASGQLLLLLPADATGTRTPTNPYLNLQPGLTTAASLVAGTVMTKEAERAMRADGYTSEYSVALNPETGPLLVVTAKDTDTRMALRTRDEVINRLDESLMKIQVEASVPTRQLIHSTHSSVTDNAEALPGSKIRALAAIVGAGTVLTLIVAFSLDRLSLRRQAGRAAPEADRDSSPDDERPMGPRRVDRSPGDGAAKPPPASSTTRPGPSDRQRPRSPAAARERTGQKGRQPSYPEPDDARTRRATPR